MTVKDMEKVFEDFQRTSKVETERHRIIGMIIRIANTKSDREDFNIVSQLENLVSMSEKEGFKSGFKAALQMMTGNMIAKEEEKVQSIQKFEKRKL